MKTSTILAVHRDEGLDKALEQARPNPQCTYRNASCGLEALEILDTQVPDLVILDTDFSLQSSLCILKEIRKILPELPVIVVTRPDRDETKRIALEQGASLYLDKPLNAEVLRHLLLYFLTDSEPSVEFSE